MIKTIVISFVILLALASSAGYLYLNGRIIAGEKLIADGRIRIAEETANLVDGKARLEAGKLKMAAGAKRYEEAHNNMFLRLADKVLKGGKGFRDARGRMADGDERVARGEEKVSVGEDRLEAGTLKLQEGIKLVGQAKSARVACAIGAAFCIALAAVLAYFWRWSLARTLLRIDH